MKIFPGKGGGGEAQTVKIIGVLAQGESGLDLAIGSGGIVLFKGTVGLVVEVVGAPKKNDLAAKKKGDKNKGNQKNF